MRNRAGMAFVVASALWGCNALDESGVDGRVKRITPTDSRPVRQALTTPPPITGGTLAVDVEGAFAVVADPDRDRVSIVDLRDHGVSHVALEPGDRPGRIAIDAAGRAHVTLRGTGELLTLALDDGAVLARGALCAAPRGLAYDAAQSVLHVACAEGKLLSVDPNEGAVMRELSVPEDVRDVIVRPGGVSVSRFKSAELLSYDAQGQLLSLAQPPKSETLVFEPSEDPLAPPTQAVRTMQPHLAWRSASQVGAMRNEMLMLHQASLEGEIDIDAPEDAELQAASSPYGGDASASGGCGGVVQTQLALVDAQMRTATTSLAQSVLSVDLAVSPGGEMAAIAQAGARDPEAPQPFVLRAEQDEGFREPPRMAGDLDTADVLLVRTDHLRDFGAGGCTFPEPVELDAQAVAVAFTTVGDLVVQTREPARLVVLRSPPFGEREVVELGGESVADTGHDLFHRNSGGGIACASCHGEGGDDGHVWSFSGIGERRTQAVHVGLAGTEPFHWDGDMRDLGHLMGEVFVGRMGGVNQSEARLEALGDWLFSLRAPRPMLDPEDAAAQRGKHLFESEAVGCTNCHSGDKLTSSGSVDVGTTPGGHELQVPSLRGIAYRAPFIHDGCAPTLRDRFTDPGCGGGDMHGTTSQLSDAEIDDLVAYLKTL